MFNIGFSELLLVLLVGILAYSAYTQKQVYQESWSPFWWSGRRICPRLPAGWGAR